MRQNIIDSYRSGKKSVTKNIVASPVKKATPKKKSPSKISTKN